MVSGDMSGGLEKVLGTALMYVGGSFVYGVALATTVVLGAKSSPMWFIGTGVLVAGGGAIGYKFYKASE